MSRSAPIFTVQGVGGGIRLVLIFQNDIGNRYSSIDNVIADFTRSDSERFGRFLTEKWAKYPDAITVQDVAKLMSCRPIRLYNLIESGKLFGAKVWNVTYCSKASLITYASSLTAVKRSKSKGYLKLIQEFAKKEIR